MSEVLAIRGQRLVLNRFKTSGRDKGPDAFYSEVLNVIELMSTSTCGPVVFDLEDFESA